MTYRPVLSTLPLLGWLLTLLLFGCCSNEHGSPDRSSDLSPYLAATPLPPLEDVNKRESLLLLWNPYSSVHLGAGVDPLDPSQVKDCPLDHDGIVAEDTGVRDVQFSIELITSYEQLYSALNVDVRGEAHGLFLKGSFHTNVANSAQVDSGHVVLLVKGVCDYGRHGLKNMRLSETARAMAADKDRFFARYGSHVAVLESRLTTIGAIIEFDTRGETNKSKVQVDVALEANFLFAGGKVETHVTSESNRLISNGKATVRFFATGGQGLKDLAGSLNFTYESAEAKAAASFFSAVKTAIQSYVANLNETNSPARQYFCMPLANLRDELLMDKDSRLLWVQERAATGLVERQKAMASHDEHMASVAAESDEAKKSMWGATQARLDIFFFRDYFDLAKGDIRKVPPTAEERALKLEEDRGGLDEGRWNAGAAAVRRFIGAGKVPSGVARATLRNPALRWDTWLRGYAFNDSPPVKPAEGEDRGMFLGAMTQAQARFASEADIVFTIESTQGNAAQGTLVWSAQGLSSKAVSGPFGNGALPRGLYNLTQFHDDVHNKDESYCSRVPGETSCWFQRIEAVVPNGRTGLGIHPDGHVDGTEGCVGLKEHAPQWRSKLMGFVGPLRLEVR